jgi:hypothetical protein
MSESIRDPEDTLPPVLEGLIQPHLESFDAFLRDGLDALTAQLPPIVIKNEKTREEMKSSFPSPPFV